MSKNAKPEFRGLTLSLENELIDGSTMLSEFKTQNLTTKVKNLNEYDDHIWAFGRNVIDNALFKDLWGVNQAQVIL